MPSTKKQRAEKKGPRQSDVLSDLDDVNGMIVEFSQEIMLE